MPGNEKRPAPRSEIQPIEQSYTEGKSTFYLSSRETFKLDTRIPPGNPPYPVQDTEDDNLGASVTSQDVAMQQKVNLC